MDKAIKVGTPKGLHHYLNTFTLTQEEYYRLLINIQPQVALSIQTHKQKTTAKILHTTQGMLSTIVKAISPIKDHIGSNYYESVPGHLDLVIDHEALLKTITEPADYIPAESQEMYSYLITECNRQILEMKKEDYDNRLH